MGDLKARIDSYKATIDFQYRVMDRKWQFFENNSTSEATFSTQYGQQKMCTDGNLQFRALFNTLLSISSSSKVQV